MVSPLVGTRRVNLTEINWGIINSEKAQINIFNSNVNPASELHKRVRQPQPPRAVPHNSFLHRTHSATNQCFSSVQGVRLELDECGQKHQTIHHKQERSPRSERTAQASRDVGNS